MADAELGFELEASAVVVEILLTVSADALDVLGPVVELPAYCAVGVLVVRVSPHCTNKSHVNDVAVTDFPASRQRMMWPYRLLARGLAASTAGRAEPAAVEPSAAL